VITKYGTDSERQDSCFYSDGSGQVVAWSLQDCDYYVVASGEMKIYYTAPDGKEHTLYTTADLDELGFDTDSKISAVAGKGEEVWSWQNNNWFEVYSDTDLDFCSEPIGELDRAIEYALELAGKQMPSGIGQEPDLVY
jgi:CRP-like cAMP-binding protein